ncbi:type II toxin-antitoxin system HicA family toxin [Methanospirillum stamsii]|uniref:type II toxin-antitoxin system HicA family toxin n=1 Tax=Methanospirillum stamsii TaxID=1277351 RepID=UPI0034E05C3E
MLEKRGFTLVRQTGSHKIYRNDKQVRVTVPYHSGEILHPKNLNQIIINAELSFEDLK